MPGLEEFYSYRGRCYKYFADRKIYSEARRKCKSLKVDSIEVDLVSIRNNEESRFITDLPSWPSKASNWEAWIGIEKLTGSWDEYQRSGQWSDGLKHSGWTNWEDGEPNNFAGVVIPF